MALLNENGSKELIKFLYEIKKRPGLFLNIKSLSNLRWVIMGFTTGYFCAFKHDLTSYCQSTKNNSIWTKFSNHLNEKYNMQNSSYKELIEYSQSEEKAFDLFFEELEAFLIENGVEIPLIS